MDKNLITKEELLRGLQDFKEDTTFAVKFQDLMSIMFLTAQLKGWHSPAKSFGEQVLMMHSELSEVVEEYRVDGGDTNKIWYSSTDEGTKKPEGVPIEFADLSIREFDTCIFYNIDLLKYIIMKAEFNLTRPDRHGNKKL